MKQEFMVTVGMMERLERKEPDVYARQCLIVVASDGRIYTE